ncbi:MAG: DUF3823 domain-containing protein [Prevotellaceae bacterium]|jgi:hypothetical protein|nr:DUF3823 domain-containing protein [Prevotellaceae bacterium]
MKKVLLQTSLWATLAAVAVTLAACALDNYDEPDAQITGKVVDRSGNPVGVMGSRGQVTLQLWQPSYPLKADAISVNVSSDGSFAAKVFNGEYVLKMRNNTGPWVNNTDSVVINLNGSASVDFPVTPYYTLGAATYSLNGTTLTATFSITEVTAGRSIDEVALMVNKTQFVGFDGEVHVKKETSGTDVGSHTIAMDIGDLTEHRKLYARVGLRISGIGQGLYDAKTFAVR